MIPSHVTRPQPAAIRFRRSRPSADQRPPSRKRRRLVFIFPHALSRPSAGLRVCRLHFPSSFQKRSSRVSPMSAPAPAIESAPAWTAGCFADSFLQHAPTPNSSKLCWATKRRRSRPSRERKHTSRNEKTVWLYAVGLLSVRVLAVGCFYRDACCGLLLRGACCGLLLWDGLLWRGSL